LIWALAGATSYAQVGTISGAVRDSVTHTGLPGANVTITDIKSHYTVQTIAASDGSFRVEHLTPSQYLITCKVEGYQTLGMVGFSRTVTLAGAEELRVPIDLTAVSSLSGVVTDEEGRPLEGVDVYIENSLRGATAADGAYTLDQLSAGSHQMRFRIPLEIRKRALQKKSDTGEWFTYPSTMYYPGIADPQAAIPITISPGLNLHGFDVRLRRVRVTRFAGRLLERVGGAPVSARVELETPGFLDETYKVRPTDSDGRFSFELLPAGHYSLLVYREAAPSALPWVMPVDLPAAGIEGMNIAVPPYPVLGGVVSTPNAVAWMGNIHLILTSVDIHGQNREMTVTGERFSLGQVPPGRWRLSARADALREDLKRMAVVAAPFGGRDGLTEELMVTESGNPPLEIRLSSHLGRLIVKLVDADGKPVDEYIIFCTRAGTDIRSAMLPEAMVRATEKGTFVREGLAPGRYQISADSRERYRGAVEIRADETTVIELRPEKR
jgi:Carboxypeptidase regulatory-like domain